ncbi:hypothetical protein PoB_007130700 [Plakobranchus ocellatus]|uniref:RNase H type-1 domain-containing protein n=1 Tax=Plakobranchus ocellatus TaxID=259542 RepID=A0AAV4DKK1_9GAST|nr:hypothetical protein PoB_007130700 [Plakobranchus ocellatus]
MNSYSSNHPIRIKITAEVLNDRVFIPSGVVGDGRYGIYILWPDETASRICGPVGEMTRSHELKAVNECLRVVMMRQRERAALPGVVIFTDCRVLVQALGGSGRESVGGMVL